MWIVYSLSSVFSFWLTGERGVAEESVSFNFLPVHLVKVFVASITAISSKTKSICDRKISTVSDRKLQPAIYLIDISASITQQ